MTDTTERMRRFKRLSLPPPVFAPTLRTGELEAEPGSVEPTPTSAATVALVTLAFLAVCVALYVGRGLLMPIAISIMLGFLLRPPVRWLRARGIKEAFGAGIVVLGGVLIAVGIARILAAPASSWLQRAPQAIESVARKLQSKGGPVAQLEATAAKVEQIASGGAPERSTRQVTQTPARTPLLRRMFGDLTDFVGGIFSVIFLTFFLLASGDVFMRKITDMMPRGRARMPREISAEIESSITRYLRTVTLINIALGLATWGVLAALRMPNAALFGMLAGVLNVVPYLGAVATAGILGLAAIASFDSIGHALLIPGAFLALNVIEANIVTPVLIGREFPLNPVAVFVGLLFWGFVWGVPGAILAVPMMVTIKIFCDRVPSLRAIGEFLGP